MNHIPHDLAGFDFCWSACALEHLGSIELGLQFLMNMTRCLKPGRIGVHTTEFNVYSNDATLEKCFATGEHQNYVLFRRRDIESLEQALQKGGYNMEVDYNPGNGEADLQVDWEPFTNPNPYVHLKIGLGGFVSTSMGLIVEPVPHERGPAFLRVHQSEAAKS